MMTTDESELEPDDGDEDNGAELEPTRWDARSVIDHALDRVRDNARAHPLTTIGAAGGVGYVLGGGVPKLWVLIGLAVTGGIVGYALPAVLRGAGAIPDADGSNDDAEAPAPPQTPAKPKHRRSKTKRAQATGV